MKKVVIPNDFVQSLYDIGIEPRDLVFYINSQCNLRCGHCYVGNPLLSQALSYNPDDACRLISDLGELSRLTVLGGEPLLHRGINEILDVACQSPIGERRLTTNLTHYFRWKPTAQHARNFTIAVSLDGGSAREHEKIRGAHTFEKTIRNIKILLALGFDVEITHTATTQNLPSFHQLLELCKRIGVRKLNLHRMSLLGNAVDNPHFEITPEKWIEFCNTLEHLSVDPNQSGTLCVRFPPMFVKKEEYEDIMMKKTYWHHAHQSFYSEDRGNRVVLFSDGRVYISSELFGTDSYIGEIREGSFLPNKSSKSEITYFREEEKQDRLISDLNKGLYKNIGNFYPLSVSFKRMLMI